MSEPRILSKPPIVEAVLDIDCDMSPGQDLAALEAPARDAFRDRYPKFRTRFIHEGQIELQRDDLPKFSARRGIQALQFLHDDEKQLVQVRALGFSFNRLAPYSTLDDYLPEIERTWRLFVSLASPVQIRVVRTDHSHRHAAAVPSRLRTDCEGTADTGHPRALGSCVGQHFQL